MSSFSSEHNEYAHGPWIIDHNCVLVVVTTGFVEATAPHTDPEHRRYRTCMSATSPTIHAALCSPPKTDCPGIYRIFPVSKHSGIMRPSEGSAPHRYRRTIATDVYTVHKTNHLLVPILTATGLRKESPGRITELDNQRTTDTTT